MEGKNVLNVQKKQSAKRFIKAQLLSISDIMIKWLSSMVSKPINIRCIRTSSHPYGSETD